MDHLTSRPRMVVQDSHASSISPLLLMPLNLLGGYTDLIYVLMVVSWSFASGFLNRCWAQLPTLGDLWQISDMQKVVKVPQMVLGLENRQTPHFRIYVSSAA